MLRLVENLNSAVYRPLSVVVAATDGTSLKSVAASSLPERWGGDVSYVSIPRAREVRLRQGQGQGQDIYTQYPHPTLYRLFH
jgi:hypothetical protein